MENEFITNMNKIESVFNLTIDFLKKDIKEYNKNYKTKRSILCKFISIFINNDENYLMIEKFKEEDIYIQNSIYSKFLKKINLKKEEYLEIYKELFYIFGEEELDYIIKEVIIETKIENINNAYFMFKVLFQSIFELNYTKEEMEENLMIERVEKNQIKNLLSMLKI